MTFLTGGLFFMLFDFSLLGTDEGRIELRGVGLYL